MKARLVVRSVDIFLLKAANELKTKGTIAELTFADSKTFIDEINKLSNKLAKKLEQISQPDMRIHNTNKKYQIALLVTDGMAKANKGAHHYNYTHFWKIKEDLELLHAGAKCALEMLNNNWDKYYPISHPRDYFLRQSIGAYKHFLIKDPPIYRDSKFVQAIDIALKASNLGLRGVTTYKLLLRAKQQNNREQKVLVW